MAKKQTTKKKQPQPKLEKEKERKDGMPYRPLTIPERDMLFALYDKHNGNRLAMTRDQDCLFKSYNQLTYYCRFYHFSTRLAETRRKRAEEIINQLSDYKIDAVRRAADMMQPRQVPVMYRLPDGTKQPMKDADGNPVFQEVYPSDREIKTAWEIIKTELGEPTTISKSEVNNPHAEEVKQALDAIAQLSHGKSQTNGDTVQGERGAAGDTAEVPAPVQHDIPEEPSED